MDSYLQPATVIRETLARPAQLSAAGIAAITPTVITGSGGSVSGALTVAASADPKAWPEGGVVLVTAADADPLVLFRAASAIARRLSRLVGRGGFDRLPGPLAGWTKYRRFPAMAGETFTARRRRTR